jgi:lipopolysaccharide transport system ATP-binding protein
VDREYIWALKDVSFDVKHGEVVGVIGRNGVGKSTLLKVLSRITEPTEGYAEISGRIGSLLEVGTGFHPELTGRENIYLNGVILGMKKVEVERNFDTIVSFAEIDKFLDTPVKRYSSGMYVRLAFAVAAHLEPEILLVDEVLAVGDTAFQKKCLGKMDDLAKEGRTVLFVSHNMGAVSRLCQRALWIDAGCLHLSGTSEEVVSKYLTSGSVLQGQISWGEGVANPGVNEFKLHWVAIWNSDGHVGAKVDGRKPFFVEIGYCITQELAFCRIGFVLSTVHGFTVFEVYDSDDERYLGPRKPGKYTTKCEIPGNFLNTGSYVLSVNAGMPGIKNLVFLEAILSFDVEDAAGVGSPMDGRRDGIMRPKLTWEVTAG